MVFHAIIKMYVNNGRRQYTPAQKAAYYRKLAASQSSKSQGSYYSSGNKKPAYKVYAPPPPPPSKRVAKKKGGALSSAGGTLGGMAGSVIGGAPGAAIGKFLGGKLGHLVEQITGFGDYNIQSNSIMDGSLQPPEVVNTMNKGGVIVRHREYIGDVLASTGFSLRKFTVNPGLPETFPWLAQIATAYEQYRWRGILFEFVSTSSDALLSSATSSALGTVNMSTLYNVTDPDFTDKRQMLNHEYSNSNKPSCSFIHPIECAPSQTPYKYYNTRSAAVPVDADPQRFDFCHFYLMTEGQQASGGVLGELWVTYEVEFLKQQFDQIILTDHYRFKPPGLSNTQPVGGVTGSNLGSGGTMGGLMSGDGRSYSFPPYMGSGLFLVFYDVIGPNNTALVAPSVTLVNCSLYPILLGDLYSDVTNGGSTDNFFNQVLIVRVTAQGASITWGIAGTLPSTPTDGDLIVTQLASSLRQLPV